MAVGVKITNLTLVFLTKKYILQDRERAGYPQFEGMKKSQLSKIPISLTLVNFCGNKFVGEHSDEVHPSGFFDVGASRVKGHQMA